MVYYLYVLCLINQSINIWKYYNNNHISYHDYVLKQCCFFLVWAFADLTLSPTGEHFSFFLFELFLAWSWVGVVTIETNVSCFSVLFKIQRLNLHDDCNMLMSIWPEINYGAEEGRDYVCRKINQGELKEEKKFIKHLYYWRS